MDLWFLEVRYVSWASTVTFRGGNVYIFLMFFRLLSLQCKRTFTIRFTVFTQRQCSVKASAPLTSFLKFFWADKVARRPWAPRTSLEFPIKTGYVLDPWKTFFCPEYFPASFNSCGIVHYCGCSFIVMQQCLKKCATALHRKSIQSRHEINFNIHKTTKRPWEISSDLATLVEVHTSILQRCTFYHPLQLFLNWHINIYYGKVWLLG